MASFHQSMPNQQQIPSVQRQYQSQPIQRQVHSLPFRQEERQQQPQQKEQNKKKCRGDRQAQRYRAKLRKRGLTNDEIMTLIRNCKTNRQEKDENHTNIPDVNAELFIPTQTQVRFN